MSEGLKANLAHTFVLDEDELGCLDALSLTAVIGEMDETAAAPRSAKPRGGDTGQRPLGDEPRRSDDFDPAIDELIGSTALSGEPLRRFESAYLQDTVDPPPEPPPEDLLSPEILFPDGAGDDEFAWTAAASAPRGWPEAE